MTKAQKQDVLGKLDWEGGFEYFIGGSSFKEVKDKKFHQLREDFIKAHNALSEYLGELE